jgi:hypothetical protein
MRKASQLATILVSSLIGTLATRGETVRADPPIAENKSPAAAPAKVGKAKGRKGSAPPKAAPALAAAASTARFGTEQCDVCLKKNCNPQYGTVNLVSDCVDATCEQTFACFQRNRCAVDTVTMPRCYCGNVSLEACRASGFDAKGPCADMVEAGLKTKNASEVIDRLVGTDTSTGDGAALFACAAESCISECLKDPAIPRR